MVRGGLKVLLGVQEGLQQWFVASARCDRDVYCGCKLNVVVMEADVPAELEGLVRGIVDVELTLFIKVSSPFLLYL